jgi:outer membrane protein
MHKKKVLSAAILFALLTALLPMLPAIALAEEYTLDDLYRLALKQAEKVQIAEQDVYIAERQKDKAIAVLLPKITTLGDYRQYTKSELGPTGTTIQPDFQQSFTARFDQSLSTSGREFTALNIVKSGITKSKYDLYSVKEDYVQRVAIAYYDVFRTQRAVEIQTANVARVTKYRAAAQTRLRVGEVTKTSVLRAEAELSGAQSDLVKATNIVDLAKAILARIVGISGDYTLKESMQPEIPLSMSRGMAIDNCPVIDMECFQSKAQSERSELRSLETQKKIAEDQVKYAQGSYWPIFSAEGVYFSNKQDPAPITLVRESMYAGVRLTFPLFEGGLRRAEIAEAQAKLRQAKLGLADARKQVDIDVEGAYLDLKTQAGILKSLEDQVAFAQDNYAAVAKQFEFGLSNSIDVIDANTLLVTAERQLTDVQFNYQMAILRLKRTTGTLLRSAMNGE